jgi:hypothetical protein
MFWWARAILDCMRLTAAAVLLVILAIATPGYAISLNELDINGSLMVVGSVPPAGYGDVSPVIQLLGASLPLKLGGPFYFEPELEFFGLLYEWVDANGVAVPTRIEAQTGFWTLGTIISMHAGARFPLSSKLSLGGSIGADFLLRFPIELWNKDASGMGPALSYFFAQGRFFYPETTFSVIWQVSDPIGLILNLRALYPVFHFWDGMGQPFVDQFIFGAGIGIAIRLGPAPKPASPAASAPKIPVPANPAPAAPAPAAPAPEAINPRSTVAP